MKVKKLNFQKKKNTRRNQIIVGVILVVVMLFSTLGYAFQGIGDEENGGVEKINYNGLEFVNSNGFWMTQIGDFVFGFKYNPEEVERLSGKVDSLEKYYNKPLYISSENNVASSEIVFNFNNIVQRIQSACIKGEKCEEDYPIKTCENNFIIIREGKNSSIVQEENCVFIEGELENLVNVTDEFLFKVLSIVS